MKAFKKSTLANLLISHRSKSDPENPPQQMSRKESNPAPPGETLHSNPNNLRLPQESTHLNKPFRNYKKSKRAFWGPWHIGALIFWPHPTPHNFECGPPSNKQTRRPPPFACQAWPPPISAWRQHGTCGNLNF